MVRVSLWLKCRVYWRLMWWWRTWHRLPDGSRFTRSERIQYAMDFAELYWNG